MTVTSASETFASEGYRPQLDSLRTFAVFAVLVTHFWQPGPFPGILRYLDFGFLGVRLFFVLSGFLITRILLEGRDRAEAEGLSHFGVARRFYARRFLRIFPLYYFIIIVAVLIDLPLARDRWPWLVTYTPNFFVALYQQSIGRFGHFWTLAVEEQFYLIWPWLVLAAPWRWLTAMVTAVVTSAPIFREIFMTRYGEAWGVLPWGSLDTLGVGALLAIVFHHSPYPHLVYDRLRRVVLPIGLVGYVGLHALTWLSGTERLFGAFHEIAYAMICCWLIAGADRGFGGMFGRVLSIRPVIYLGKISYGIYAYHMFMPWALTKAFLQLGLTFPPPGPTRFVLTSVVAVAVAMLSWHLLEHPINRLKRYFPYEGRTRARPVAPRLESEVRPI
jgi:peptidoglycan/LPS O-acetylase OafA/YrhL